MNICEIREALREVRRICEGTLYCADCPLSVCGGCPMKTVNEEPVAYPANWPLDWEDEDETD